MLDYQETNRCIYPHSETPEIKEVFSSIFSDHKDYRKTDENGYDWFLHLGVKRVTPSICLYLVMMDDDKLMGVETAMYHIDANELELCSTATTPEYRGKGLAKVRLVEIMKIIDCMTYKPKKVAIKDTRSKAGKSNALKLGFKQIGEHEFEISYDELVEKMAIDSWISSNVKV